MSIFINAAKIGKIFGKMFLNSTVSFYISRQTDRQTEPSALSPHNALHQFTQSCSRAAFSLQKLQFSATFRSEWLRTPKSSADVEGCGSSLAICLSVRSSRSPCMSSVWDEPPEVELNWIHLTWFKKILSQWSNLSNNSMQVCLSHCPLTLWPLSQLSPFDGLSVILALGHSDLILSHVIAFVYFYFKFYLKVLKFVF